jgi:hypothetical protein
LKVGIPKPYTHSDEKLSSQTLKDGGHGEKFATILLTAVTRIVAVGGMVRSKRKNPADGRAEGGIGLKDLVDCLADAIKRGSSVFLSA